MTFYNPFFPHFPRIPYSSSTGTTQNVNNTTHAHNSCNNSENNCKTNVPTLYQKNYKSQGLLQNYLKETDTLIILGLLFFLYTQENKDFSLMLCLFLLLFEN